jgi:hypothetical protein
MIGVVGIKDYFLLAEVLAEQLNLNKTKKEYSKR